MQRQRRTKEDDPLMAVIEPALKVGAFAGGAGFLIGGTAGILKSTTPTLFATASAIQTFALASTFWATRGFVLQSWPKINNHNANNPSDQTRASALAGGISGGLIGGLTRGKSNVLPGAIMIALFGGAGQALINHYSAREVAEVEAKPGFWRRLSEKKWSPMRMMTNEEYAELLRGKMDRFEVEIAIVDEKIAKLRELEQRGEATIQPNANPN